MRASAWARRLTLDCNAASARVGEAVQPLPKHSLSRHDAAPSPDHELVPGDRVPIRLISLARKTVWEEMAPDALRHRLLLDYGALARGVTVDACIEELLGKVPAP